MSKVDRIPEAWPPVMSDAMAAQYLDFSLSQFRALVASGKLPAGQKVWGTENVRWRQAQLDAAINLEFGLPAKNGGANLSVASDEDEWDKAIRNAA
jgi:hypothetical protein